ncbi:MAG: hypothetical protein H6842_13285 [Rhodospirillaceae bacterium]|nr:hypothetical protein [Rhodospirillaceae bacterium]
MSFDVETARIQEYRNNLDIALQQRGSKLRGAVTVATYRGKAGKAVERVAPVTAQRVTARHADTPLISTPHDARWVYPVDYDWADLVDTFDQLRVGVELTGAYTMNGAYALGRAIDDEIITAFFGAAKTGENGSTDTAFDTSGQQIASGSAGLTVAKLKDAKRTLMANEVDLDFDPIYCAITAAQHDDLLNQIEVTSLDFTNRPVLTDGRLTSFLGIQFIHTERLGVDGSSDRRVPVWAKSGMHLGLWDDIVVDIAPRRDKRNAIQVYARVTCGAARLDEKRVVEVLCTES